MATSEYVRQENTRSGPTPSPSPFTSGRPSPLLRSSLLDKLPAVLSDIFAILLALGLSLLFREWMDLGRFHLIRMQTSIGNKPLDLLYLAWFTGAYALIARRYGLYGQTINASAGSHELRRTIQACLNAGILLCGVIYMTHNLSISRVLVLLFIFTAMIMLCVRRAIWRLRRYRLYDRGLATRHVAIIGVNHLSLALGRQISNQKRLGYTLCGYMVGSGPSSVSTATTGDAQVLGRIDEIHTIVRRHFIDEVIVTESYPLDEVIW